MKDKNVILLNGQDIEHDKKLLTNINELGTLFVLNNENIKLYEYIEKLELTYADSFKIRICKEIKGLDLEYHIAGEEKTEEIYLLSDLLKIITLDKPSTVVVKGDADGSRAKMEKVRTQVSDIVQQFIYLGLPLDKSSLQVVTEKESKDLEKVERFERALSDLRKMSLNSVYNIDSINADKHPKYKTNALESITKINTYLQEAGNTELNITVAASKKTGKSVIVNSIIGEEIAPTSKELATPCNIIYSPSDNGTITVGYDKNLGNNKKYSSVIEAKDYILKEFKKAEKNIENKLAIDDMYIQYIPADNGNLSKYIIWDTPGPDLAGAEGHKERAEEALRNADVTIFAMDYTKYLQTGETEYLNQVKEAFIAKDKVYSLIICLNKLDECFKSNSEDKCFIRALDFIKNKLINIDSKFKDCVIFATSALTYFDALEAPRINNPSIKDGNCAVLAEKTNFQDLKDELELCIDRYVGEKEMRVLAFVDEQMNDYKRFVKCKIDSLDGLKQKSGMPSLLNYIKYIAENKARVECVNNYMHNIDSKMADIQNIFNFDELAKALALNNEKLEIAKNTLRNFINNVEKIYSDDYREFTDNSNQILCDFARLNNNTYDEYVCRIKTFLKEISDDRTIEFDKMVNEADKDLDSFAKDSFDIEGFIDKVLEILISKVQRDVGDKIASSQDSVFLQNTNQKIISVDEIRAIYAIVLNSLSKYGNELLSSKKIEADTTVEFKRNELEKKLKDLINNRLYLLKLAVEICKMSLKEECGIQFEFVVPTFAFSPQNKASFQKVNLQYDVESINNSLNRLIGEFSSENVMDWKDKIDNLLRCNIGDLIRGVARVQYDSTYAAEIFGRNFRTFISQAILDAKMKDQVWKPYMNSITDSFKIFTKEASVQLKRSKEDSGNKMKDIEDIIEGRNSRLNEDNESIVDEQRILNEINSATSEIISKWREVVG